MDQHSFDLIVNALVALEPALLHKVIHQRGAFILDLKNVLSKTLGKSDRLACGRRAISHHHLHSLEMELDWLDEIEKSIDDWDI